MSILCAIAVCISIITVFFMMNMLYIIIRALWEGNWRRGVLLVFGVLFIGEMAILTIACIVRAVFSTGMSCY